MPTDGAAVSAGAGAADGAAGPPADPFPRIDGELVCDGIPLREIAAGRETPFYLYSGSGLQERYRRFDAAFAAVDHLVAVSVKANGNPVVLNRLAALGAGADIVSAGELELALMAGIPAGKVVFAGAGKTEAEMRRALEAGIGAFNVENPGELRLLDDVASSMERRAPFALRLNPDIVSPTPFEYTRTGHLETKFGIPLGEGLDLYRWAAARPSLRPVGVDVHIGSQIVDPGPYREALDAVLGVVEACREDGVELGYVDVGGGYGVAYGDRDGGEEAAPAEMDLRALARALAPPVREAGLRLVLEPGRWILGEPGVLLTRVLYVKRTPKKTFVITDAGMTELLRPSHYGGHHRVDPVVERRGRERETVDVVGPICETGDFLARDRTLALPEPGELLALRTAGAYGWAMAMNYNGRLRPAELLVEGGSVREIRRRERVEELVSGVDMDALVEVPAP